ncbi:MAG: ArsA-related P-loop ATPase, partial [Bdellovibrionota bacterium]
MGDKNPSLSLSQTPPLTQVIHRKLLFITGKGGVGKTAVSLALAKTVSEQGLRVLWVTFEDPNRPAGEIKKLSPTLSELNCDAGRAFEEYAGLKIGISKLAHIFVGNKLMQYLSKAAPG